MKKVFIKYNPYQLKTEFTVDGKELAKNSVIRDRISSGSRLQEWVEDLPQLLCDDWNDTDFDIDFYGTLLDYEDLYEVFTKACKDGKLTGKLKHIPAKETSNMEDLIDEVFEEIKQGPFDELRSEDIVSAFQNAKSSDFEVCVVAPVSTGKSTLINSMLGTKLMPSKQGPCTALITRIKDVEAGKSWKAEVYDKHKELRESYENLTFDVMSRLNEDDNVSTIEITGDIPFVSAEDMSLVLVDTPGYNNARNPDHKRIQSEFLNKSSKSLILYVMESTFGTDDDYFLLSRVAESMKVAGKQSKDRFIFVVNKLDGRNTVTEPIDKTLEEARKYLHGSFEINNPNLFPAAALPALNIRLLRQNDCEMDDYTKEETKMKVDKMLNPNEALHLEKYAPLPQSVRDGIDMEVKEAKEKQIAAKSEDERLEAAMSEALVHTGIVSIEAAIRQYVQKYAKTAKIKNIVDTFMHKVEEVGCEEKTKQELAKNKEDGKRIAAEIDLISKKIDDINAAKHFDEEVKKTLAQVEVDVREFKEKIRGEYQKKIQEKIDDISGRKLDINEAEFEVEAMKKYADNLQPQFMADLNEISYNKLVETSNALLREYKSKVADLTNDLGPNAFAGVEIDPLKLVTGSIDFSLDKLIHYEEIEIGGDWIKNPKKKWYKPWTWGLESKIWKPEYENREFISSGELAQDYFALIEEEMKNGLDQACDHANEQCQKIAESFRCEFERLNGVLKEKLIELKDYATNKKKAEERIKETEKRLNWLTSIENKIASILEI